MVNFEELEVYRVSDGTMFEDYNKALEHYENLLGEELDGLLKLFGFDGRITRNDEYNALMRLLKNKKELKKQISVLHSLLDVV